MDKYLVDIICQILFYIIEGYIAVYLYRNIVCNIFSGLLTKVVITISCWIGINCLSGQIIYMLFRSYFSIIHFLVFLVLLFILIIFLFKRIDTDIKLDLFPNKNINYIIIATIIIIFIILLFSTDGFVSIFGNVDELTHYEVANGFTQKMWYNYQDIPFLSFNMKHNFYIIPDRYSYFFGYHFFCGMLSKIFFIDTIYITHFVRCISIALFLGLPLGILSLNKDRNNKARNILTTIFYLSLIILAVSCWYVFLYKGFTAQLFSLPIMLITYIYIQNYYTNVVDRNGFSVHNIIIILFLWLTITSYTLSGLLLILWYLLVIIINKDYKNIINILIPLLIFALTPQIMQQIKSFFTQSDVDVAITAGYSGDKFLSKYIIIIYCSMVLINALYSIINKRRFICLSSCSAIFVLFFWFFGERDGYIIYKTFFTSFFILVIELPICLFDIIKRLKLKIFINYILYFLICIILIAFLNIKCGLIDYSGYQNVIEGNPSIDPLLYNCYKYLNNNPEIIEDSEIDCVGIDGTRTYNLLLTNLGINPIGFYGPDGPTSRNIIFNSETAATYERTLKRMCFKEDLKNNLIIIYKNGFPSNDNDILSISKVKTIIYENDKYTICKYKLKDNLFLENYFENHTLNEKNYELKEIQGYGKSYIPKMISNYNSELLDLDSSKNLFQIGIEGRSIHNSNIILRIHKNNGNYYDLNCGEFEHYKIININDNDIKNIEFITQSNNVKDGIIVTSLHLYYAN